VYQVDNELGAQEAQVMAGKACVIVQEQPARNPSAGNRVVQHGDKTVFCFSETGFQVGDDPAAAKARGLTATFPPFLRLTILIKCRRNQQAHTAESSDTAGIRKSNAKIFLVEECAERSHPHGSISRVTTDFL
jgi:hypothetical protein